MRHQSHGSKRVLEAVRTSDTVCRMADGYAPALFLEVLAFWFIIRWLLTARLVLFFGRMLVVIMVVGALGTIDEGRFAWAACFAGSALLDWVLLRSWRDRTAHRRRSFPRSSFVAWRGVSADDVATLCERRIGLKVDAAAPAIVSLTPPAHCVFALAGNGLWVLDDESRFGRASIGRVVACWDRSSLVAHVRHTRRRERFELSWPRHGALVRGVMPAEAPASRLAGHLVADELERRG
jgi:hypothetical protein